MRTVTIQTQVFKFSELSEETAKNAVQNFRSINVQNGWCNNIHDGAKIVGLKIADFDIQKGKIDLRKTHTYDFVARQILEHHKRCKPIYKLANNYYKNLFEIEEETQEADEISALKEDLGYRFFRSLEKEFLTMLREQYEYLISDEAIAETLDKNEMEFDEDGYLFKRYLIQKIIQ